MPTDSQNRAAAATSAGDAVSRVPPAMVRTGAVGAAVGSSSTSTTSSDESLAPASSTSDAGG